MIVLRHVVRAGLKTVARLPKARAGQRVLHDSLETNPASARTDPLLASTHCVKILPAKLALN